MNPEELKGKYRDILLPSHGGDPLRIAMVALLRIAATGCMQSQEEDEFFCKHDGSKHSCYCPAGIALDAMREIENTQ